MERYEKNRMEVMTTGHSSLKPLVMKSLSKFSYNSIAFIYFYLLSPNLIYDECQAVKEQVQRLFFRFRLPVRLASLVQPFLPVSDIPVEEQTVDEKLSFGH